MRRVICDRFVCAQGALKVCVYLRARIGRVVSVYWCRASARLKKIFDPWVVRRVILGILGRVEGALKVCVYMRATKTRTVLLYWCRAWARPEKISEIVDNLRIVAPRGGGIYNHLGGVQRVYLASGNLEIFRPCGPGPGQVIGGLICHRRILSVYAHEKFVIFLR